MQELAAEEALEAAELTVGPDDASINLIPTPETIPAQGGVDANGNPINPIPQDDGLNPTVPITIDAADIVEVP